MVDIKLQAKDLENTGISLLMERATSKSCPSDSKHADFPSYRFPIWNKEKTASIFAQIPIIRMQT